MGTFNATFGKAVPLDQADWDMFQVVPAIPPAAGRAAARLPWHRAPTLQWLTDQGLGEAFTDLVVKQPSCPREAHKREAAAALRLEAFVEDERPTAEALVALPLTVFLLDRPWNQGPSLPGLAGVRSWAEVLTHLRTISGIVQI